MTTLAFLFACAAPPNVVLLMADDLGHGDLKCYNPASPVRTPHLNDVAARGLRFNRFYAAAPVCSPTRGSCLTGRHPSRYGIPTANAGHLPAGEVTLAEALKRAGYRTGHFGKWHLGTLTTKIKDSNRGGPRHREHFAPPQEHGYDACFVTEAKVPTFDPMIRPPDAGRKHWPPVKDRSRAAAYGTRYWDKAGRVVATNLDGDDSRVIMDRAIPFIEAAVSREQPFLAVVWFHAPHLPVVAGGADTAPYKKFDAYRQSYYGCVTAMDRQVGRLRRRLRELNVAENTMVWFCSDNGPEGRSGKAPGSAGDLRGRKRSLYEGGVRVPGLLEWPAVVRRPAVTDHPAVTSDYLPTVLDAAGLEHAGKPLDGVSLMPLLRGGDVPPREPIGFAYKGQASWVGPRFKLYRRGPGKPWELYDLKDDAGERADLAGRMPGRVKRMAAAWSAWAAKK